MVRMSIISLLHFCTRDETLCHFTWATNGCVNLQQSPANCCRYKGGVPVDPLSAPGKYKIENKYGVHGLIISRYGREIAIFVIDQSISQKHES